MGGEYAYLKTQNKLKQQINTLSEVLTPRTSDDSWNFRQLLEVLTQTVGTSDAYDELQNQSQIDFKIRSTNYPTSLWIDEVVQVLP